MLKVSILVLMSLSLYAEGLDDAALQEIYTEAMWFVAVIAVMSVVSFVISRRNAEKYEEKVRLEKMAKKEEVVVSTKSQPTTTKGSEVDRLIELSKMYEEGLLSKEEFMAFKLKLYREIKEIHV